MRKAKLDKQEINLTKLKVDKIEENVWGTDI